MEQMSKSVDALTKMFWSSSNRRNNRNLVKLESPHRRICQILPGPINTSAAVLTVISTALSRHESCISCHGQSLCADVSILWTVNYSSFELYCVYDVIDVRD